VKEKQLKEIVAPVRTKINRALYNDTRAMSAGRVEVRVPFAGAAGWGVVVGAREGLDFGGLCAAACGVDQGGVRR
jgi:hypothetical protein